MVAQPAFCSSFFSSTFSWRPGGGGGVGSGSAARGVDSVSGGLVVGSAAAGPGSELLTEGVLTCEPVGGALDTALGAEERMVPPVRCCCCWSIVRPLTGGASGPAVAPAAAGTAPAPAATGRRP